MLIKLFTQCVNLNNYKTIVYKDWIPCIHRNPNICEISLLHSICLFFAMQKMHLTNEMSEGPNILNNIFHMKPFFFKISVRKQQQYYLSFIIIMLIIIYLPLLCWLYINNNTQAARKEQISILYVVTWSYSQESRMSNVFWNGF